MAGESLTYGDLLARTREMLLDTGDGRNGRPGTYRWKDEELLRYLFAGVTAMEKIRPSVRYIGMRLAERQFPPVEPTAAQIAAASDEDAARAAVLDAARATPCLVDRHYHDGLVHYACYRALQMDENDATPAYRSNMHHKRFEEIARS